MKKAVQMYAVRALAKQDYEKALRIVSEIGYEGVETAGYFGHSANEVAGWLKKYNLEAMGAHIAAEQIFDKTDETIEFEKAIGNNRLIIPWWDMKSSEDVLALAEKINKVAPKIKAAGMKLYYHNHDQEFKKDGDKYYIDILAENTNSSDLSLELDVFWVQTGGADPLEIMKKYSDRTEIFHLKDGVNGKGTLLGEGAVKLDEILPYTIAKGFSWGVVESEASEELAEQVEAICSDFAVFKEKLGE